MNHDLIKPLCNNLCSAVVELELLCLQLVRFDSEAICGLTRFATSIAGN